MHCSQTAKYNVCRSTAEAEHSAGSPDPISLALSSIPVTCTFHLLFNSYSTSFSEGTQILLV